MGTFLRRMLGIVAFFCWASASSAGQSCPTPPAGITIEPGGGCKYRVVAKDFSDDSFIRFLDVLSRDVSGGKKQVLFPAGSFRFVSPISITGANGWLVEIIGAGSKSTKFVFDNVNGIDLEGPYSLGLVDRLTVNGNGRRGMVNDPHKDKYGVLARRGANIKLGRDVVVEEFSRAGVQAYMSSTIFALGVISRNNGSDGFVSSYNSTVYAGGAVSEGNRGAAYFCEGAASLFAEDSVARGTVMDRTKGQSRGGDGYIALLGGVILADRASLAGNEDQDVVAHSNGIVSMVGATFSGQAKMQVRNGGNVLR